MSDEKAISTLENRPQYLANVGNEGLDELTKFIRPARVKIIQPTATKEFAEQFAPGDVVLVPMRQKVCSLKGTFHFVPLLFYAEWICWNPLETRGTLDSIRARSLDPESEIARMARDFKAKTQQPCPEMPKSPDGKPLNLRYLEHLNFVVQIIDPPGMNTLPVVLTFCSGEHRSGSNFAALAKARGAALFANQFAATVRRRDGKKGTWFGIDVENPTTIPAFVQDEKMFAAYHTLHNDLKKALNEQRLLVDMDDSTGDAEQTVDLQNGGSF